MTTRSLLFSLTVLGSLLLGGCGDDEPDDPRPRAEVDACDLLSPEEISEAMGLGMFGPVTEVRNPHETDGSMCSWQLPMGGREVLGTQDFADLSVEVGTYREDGECWGGDCGSAEGYLAAWREARDAHARRPSDVLDLPQAAGVVVHEDAEGVLVPEPGTDVVAHLWRCRNAGPCADAMEGLLTALADAWR